MLEMSFEDLVIFVLAIPLLFVGILLLGSKMAQKALRKRVEETLFSCDVCGCLYEDESAKKIVPCPECGRMNQRGRDRSLG